MSALGSDAPSGGAAPRRILSGFRIAVTSDRRSDDLVKAFERRGAEVLHAPALRIAPHQQDDTLVGETSAVVAARPEVVLVTTGYGVRRWFEVADAAGLGADLTAVLDAARVMARGPKAFGAVRAAGLEHVQTTAHESTQAMVDELVEDGRTYRSIAVQLHGFTDEVQLARLRDVADEVLTVTPYRWVRADADQRLSRLVDAACTGQLDAIVFTSAPGAAAVLDAAASLGRLESFVAAMRGPVMAAAVGPVTAKPLAQADVDAVIPDRYRLGALIRLVCERLTTDQVLRWRAGESRLELRGRAFSVDGRETLLSPAHLCLLRRLATDAVVVSKAELLEVLPDASDEHTLEVAMSRLRAALGVPGIITTAVKRGYRFNATRVTE